MALLGRINQILSERHMTFNELATKMGMPRPSLYTSIKTEAIKFSTLERMADVLKIDIVALIDPEASLFYPKYENIVEVNKTLVYYINKTIEKFVSLKYNQISIEMLDSYFDRLDLQLGRHMDGILRKETIEALFKAQKDDADAQSVYDNSGNPAE